MHGRSDRPRPLQAAFTGPALRLPQMMLGIATLQLTRLVATACSLVAVSTLACSSSDVASGDDEPEGSAASAFTARHDPHLQELIARALEDVGTIEWVKIRAM